RRNGDGFARPVASDCDRSCNPAASAQPLEPEDQTRAMGYIFFRFTRFAVRIPDLAGKSFSGWGTSSASPSIPRGGSIMGQRAFLRPRPPGTPLILATRALAFVLVLTASVPAGAEKMDHAAEIEALTNNLNLAWVLFAGFIVMFMHLGFALLETGLTRAKN